MPKKTVFRLVPEKEIDNRIRQVSETAQSLQAKIHNVASSICHYWQAGSGAKKIDDDKAFEAAELAAERLNHLMEASPYHRQAFAKWIMLKTPLLWSDENKKFYASKAEGKEFRMTGKMFTDARDTPFWEVSPPPKANPLDIFSEIDRLIQKAERHAKKPVEGDVMPGDVVRMLRDIRAKRPVDAAA